MQIEIRLLGARSHICLARRHVLNKIVHTQDMYRCHQDIVTTYLRTTTQNWEVRNERNAYAVGRKRK